MCVVVSDDCAEWNADDGRSPGRPRRVDAAGLGTDGAGLLPCRLRLLTVPRGRSV